LTPLLLAHASITNSLVTLATHLIGSLGLAGVGLLTMSSGVVGVPGTEPTMLFAGFNVFEGNLTLFGIIIAGLIGDLAGATIAYSIGYYGRVELLERQGGKLHMSQARLERAHRWFERHGAPVIVVSRLLPFVRAAFPYAAGVAKMPFWRFIALATLGSIVWITGLGVLGREVGSDWQAWRRHLEYVDYAGAVALVVMIAYLIRRAQRGGKDPGAGPVTPVVSRTAAPSEREPAADVVPD
jgi:membrane protein DedA with SNARE-associated domain